jgi:homoserine kinase
MAIDLWLEAEAEPADAPNWLFEGEMPPTPNPISVLQMRGVVRSEIPVGVGLGSSAAARLAALELSGFTEAGFSRLVAEEGHPDNLFAAQGRGVRLVYGRQDSVRLPQPDWAVALAVANQPLATEEARSVLPQQVPIADAVFNASRTALFVHALWDRNAPLLRAAVEDRLHQPYRRPLYPWTVRVIDAARDEGAYASAICGAGPSVFALCSETLAAPIAEAMASASGGHARPLVTRVVQ